VAERERLVVVRRYDSLDAPDAALDRITAFAARLLNAPIAIVSVVDHDRIWFKSRHGLDVVQVDRDPGLCASCVLQDDPWIVSDARTDVRTLANPLVAGEGGIRFYLGIPLRTREGFNLGALCVMDVVPRKPTPIEIAQLKDLAAVVMDELELELSARQSLTDYHEELARRELREDHIKGLMRELAHRSKNLLAVVQAIARQLAPPDEDEQRFAAALTARIQGLAYTHDLVAEQNWRGAKLRELASRHIGHFVEPAPPRVHIAGPDLAISPNAAQNVGLALHELAANAVQHGALSRSTGSVSVQWHIEERVHARPWVHLEWNESDGPPVQAPSRKKFGSLVLERLVPEGLSGYGQLVFQQKGVTWACEMPADRTLA
jgi:two-component sensor histidine kinase